MKIVKIATVGVTIALLIGCNAKTEDEEQKGVIPQYQLDAMEKAQNVEKVLQDASEKRDSQ